MIRLLIVDDIASTRENLQKLLSFEEDVEVIGTAGDGKQGLEEAHRLHPDIVLTDVNMPIMDGIQFTERLAAELPASPVIIMSVQGERDYLRRAMQAGAREYLIKPFSHDELVAAIRRVHQLEQKKGALSPKSPDTEATPRAAAAGHVIALFSGKGGVGKTLLATNLAVAVAQETKSRVALVDLDLQFGDVGVMLNLNHSRSITDIVEAGEGLETEMFNDVLGTGPAGIRVMLAPISPELADLITADHIRVVMAELRKSYDYVVVDTSCHLSEFNLEVIEMAQRILVMTTLTIPAIKDAKLALKVLESLNIDPGSILLIVNQSDGHSDFNRDSIEQNLRHPVSAQLPYDVKIVSESVTRGTPFVALNPDAAISRAVRDLVDLVAPQEAAVSGAAADKKKRKGLFSR